MEAAATSFASRRPAAHGLPQFHLPIRNPPIDIQVPSMAQSFYHSQQHYPPPLPTSALSPDSHQAMSRRDSQYHSRSRDLTYSPGVPGSGGISPLPSGVNNGTSQSPQPGIAPYNSQSSWSVPATSSYTFGPTNQSTQAELMQPNYNRSTFSPTSGGYNSRSSQSPATADGITAPPYDSVPNPYSLPAPGGGTSHSNILSQPSSQPSLQNPMMTSHTPGSQPSTPSAAAPHDSYSRPQTTSSYYSATTSPTAHHPPFPSFASAQHSPTQPSPTTTGSLSRAMTTFSTQHQPPPMQTAHYPSRSYAYQSIPTAMGGAVLSNMANPGGQMTLVSGMGTIPHGYHSGHSLGPHGIYRGPPNLQQDRPFKCDVCPQSFNRNHDLKRHKRIHLAIKPFPCTYCDKSFSRKDALKRHRLVKGCGEDMKRSPSEITELKPDPDEASSTHALKEEPA